MPPVEIVDMRKEKSLFSSRLLDLLEKCRGGGEQGIVLINRRGHANFVQCKKCGWIERCPNCSISLTYHSRGGAQICHYCGYRKEPPERCADCGAFGLSAAGAGTQKVEMELSNLIPGIRIARMDFDTTSGKNGHAGVLERFGRGNADVLLGTQMVAKGHHYPDVTVVGILSADYGLNFPDFMAAERTFQLLSQAAGRTGRGEKGGRVIVQTYTPNHYVFEYLINHDFDGFAEYELSMRKNFRYPPESDLMLLTTGSRNHKAASDVADAIYGALEAAKIGDDIALLGPAPAQIGRLRGKYRFQVLVRGKISGPVKKRIVSLAREKVSGMKGAELKWDIDPTNFF
jgi:primosomal protein N' (replication factor Y)